MQLLHPFMPFVTEELYHLLRERQPGDDLVIRQFTAPAATNAAVLAEGALAKAVITGIRDGRNKNQVKPKDTIALHIETGNGKAFKRIESILAKQLNTRELTYTQAAVPGAIALVVGKDKFYMLTDTVIDPAAQKEQLLKDLVYQQGFLKSVSAKLANEKFVQNAKPEAVEAERRKKADCEARIQAIEESIKLL
jgi:valyl-tRNA synthetase